MVLSGLACRGNDEAGEHVPSGGAADRYKLARRIDGAVMIGRSQ